MNDEKKPTQSKLADASASNRLSADEILRGREGDVTEKTTALQMSVKGEPSMTKTKPITSKTSTTNGVLSENFEKLTVVDQETGTEIAVVTDELITTAANHIAVRLTPRH